MNMYSCFKRIAIKGSFVLLTIGSSGSLLAQTPIGLDEAIALAKESNHQVLIAEQSAAAHKASLGQSRARFMPYLGVEAMDVMTDNPLNVFGFKLLQEQVTMADFDPTLLNDPDVRNQFNVSVNAMLPIYNGRSMAEHKAAKSQLNMSNAMSQRTTEAIELQVIQAYYMLQLAQRSVEVLEESHEAAQANYAIAESYYDQGLMLRSDLLDMQIMVNQTQLALSTTRTDLAIAQAQFKLVLNQDVSTDYLPIDDLKPVQDLLTPEGLSNPDRADLAAMKHGIEALEHMASAERQSYLPSLQAFGNYQLNDETPFENNAENFQVGVSLRWDLYQGNMRRNAYKKTKANIEEQALELDRMIAESDLEIITTRHQIADLKTQLEIQGLSVTQAEESLDIRKNRFAQGLEKSTDIIESENSLSQKKLAKLNSLFQLNVKSAYLELLLK